MLFSSDDSATLKQYRALGLRQLLVKPVLPSDLFNACLAALGVPSADLDQVSAPPAPQPGGASGGPLEILLAEDHAINQILALRLLERQGHRVTVAPTGRQVLAQLDQRPFDVVLMDLQMPEMSGFEVTAAIRQRERQTGAHVPIIAVTAHALPGDRKRCLDAGMDGYLAKPMQADQLLALLEPIRRGKAPPPCAQPGTTPAPLAAPAPGAGNGDSGRVADPERGVPAALPDAADPDRAFMRKSAGNDLNLLAHVLGTFQTESRALTAALRAASDRRDAPAVAGTAHTIKGCVANFGARAGRQAALAVEDAARAGDWARVERAIDALEAELERLRVALPRTVEQMRASEPVSQTP
jgi:CheY-like chemotaxis protein/HPt (histidine-containing phosphotransfer) domain-containing protein